MEKTNVLIDNFTLLFKRDKIELRFKRELVAKLDAASNSLEEMNLEIFEREDELIEAVDFLEEKFFIGHSRESIAIKLVVSALAIQASMATDDFEGIMAANDTTLSTFIYYDNEDEDAYQAYGLSTSLTSNLDAESIKEFGDMELKRMSEEGQEELAAGLENGLLMVSYTQREDRLNISALA